MFIVNVTVDRFIIERAVFNDLKQAFNYAQKSVGHKVWKLKDGTVYYGNVETKIYEPDIYRESNYIDEHILSFSHPI